MTTPHWAVALILVIISLSAIGVELVIHRYVKKVTSTYWFWLAIALVYLAYILSITCYNYWNQYAHIKLDDLTDPEQSKFISRAFMLNLCPLFCFVLPATLIADPTRKAARAVSPLALVGSFFVLFISIPMEQDISLTWRYFFIGSDHYTDLYYAGHLINFLIALGVVLNTPKGGWKGCVSTFGALLLIDTYILIVMAATGATYYVSGLHPHDFSEFGNYKLFWNAGVHNTGLSMFIFQFFILAITFATIILLDVCKRGWFKYGDKYSGCWWSWYDSQKITVKEPWGWFSHNWQLKHYKKQKTA